MSRTRGDGIKKAELGWEYIASEDEAMTVFGGQASSSMQMEQLATGDPGHDDDGLAADELEFMASKCSRGMANMGQAEAGDTGCDFSGFESAAHDMEIEELTCEIFPEEAHLMIFETTTSRMLHFQPTNVNY